MFWNNRQLQLFLSARFLVVVAGQMQSVAIAWHVYETTRDPLTLGYIGLATFIPAVGFVLFTGQVADRLSRKWITALSCVGQAAAAILLFLLVRADSLHVHVVYVLVFLVGTCRAFGGPAAQALLPSLVSKSSFSRAVALSSTFWQFGIIVGPASGGMIYAASSGSPLVYAVCCLCFAAASTLIAMLRPANTHRRLGAERPKVLDGMRYVWKRKVILGAIALDLFAVLLGGAVALLPVFAKDILSIGASGLGVLRAAPAVGAGATAIWLARNPLSRRAGPAMLVAVGIYGIATIGFGLSRSFPLSLVCLFVLGASDMISVIVRQTVVQLATPDEMRGRVSAVSLVFIGASNELGEFESGVTAAWFGTVPAVVIGGVGTCLVVLTWWFLFPALRRVDRLDPDELASPS